MGTRTAELQSVAATPLNIPSQEPSMSFHANLGEVRYSKDEASLILWHARRTSFLVSDKEGVFE